MTADVSRIIEKTLAKEGVYSNDVNDPGGETHWGISKRAYPTVDIRNLTRDGAKLIYERDYYAPLGFDGTERIDYRWKLFDVAVNMGISIAQRFKRLVAPLLPDYDAALQELADMQTERYCWLATRNPALQNFLRGWLKRANDLGADLLDGV